MFRINMKHKTRAKTFMIFMTILAMLFLSACSAGSVSDEDDNIIENDYQLSSNEENTPDNDAGHSAAYDPSEGAKMREMLTAPYSIVMDISTANDAEGRMELQSDQTMADLIAFYVRVLNELGAEGEIRLSADIETTSDGVKVETWDYYGAYDGKMGKGLLQMGMTRSEYYSTVFGNDTIISIYCSGF